MDQNYQQLDLQSLLDLLAEETEKYTKAFISGDLKGAANCKTKVDALIEEIHQRKQRGHLNEIELKGPFEYPSDATSSTR